MSIMSSMSLITFLGRQVLIS